MQTKDLKNLVGKRVAVGIPHAWDPNRLWFYNGQLLNVSTTSIELITPKDKTVIIDLDRIMQVEVD